ncbi:metallophosphoesterase family protein [Aliiruegeria sabulilitoris]|uniref:metallophosphoesterase family protein n=1 Tax=Aliiruegeria sabulilitoris TaxID=1510458 RepID=UPI0008342BE4|nr:metallophosphoesterase [Aliiruegeria sabulilitoris]
MVRSAFWTVLLSLVLLAGPASALRVVVISDLNGSYGSTSYSKRIPVAIQRIIALRPDLVISTGDMVAGQRKPVLSEGEVRAMWAAFHRVVSDPLARAGIPLAVTPGNHDASAYGGFEGERRIFGEEWRARKPALRFSDDVDYPFFYAFEMGGVRFASLDATTLGPLRGDQMARLSSVMAGSGPAVTFSHLPLWPFAQKREREIIGDPALEALYHKLGVDLHLSGHHHAFYPGWKDGVAYVSQACLGGGPRVLIGETVRSQHAFTILEFEGGALSSVKAYAGPDFRTPIQTEALPAQIRSGHAILKRLDLAQ